MKKEPNSSDAEKLAESLEDLDKNIEELDQNIEELDHTIEHQIKAHGFWPTFLRGLIGSLGALIGATLVFALIIYILQALSGTPIIGDAFRALLEQLQQNK